MYAGGMIWTSVITAVATLTGVGITQWHQRRLKVADNELRLRQELTAAYAAWAAAAEALLWRKEATRWEALQDDVAAERLMTEARGPFLMATATLVLCERQAIWAHRVDNIAHCILNSTWLPDRMGGKPAPHSMLLNSEFGNEVRQLLADVRRLHPDLRLPTVVPIVPDAPAS